MAYITDALKEAFNIIFSFDREFLQIVFISLKVSLTSTVLAAIIAIPVGIWVGVGKFKGKNLLTTLLNTSMSFPTVLVGLLFYSLLSRKGPLGEFGLLFTPSAMIIGQSILAFPIVAAFVRGGTGNLGESSLIAARILGAGRFRSGLLFLREARLIVLTSLSAGFGRVFSEVGVSMMLGGNIRFYTRNITTAIALETSKGEFSLGIALGIVLLIIAFFINLIVYHFQKERI